MSTHASKKPDLIAYVASEQADKTFYHRVGVAWSNKKGFKVVLDALPTGRELLLFPPRENDDQG